MAESYRRSQWGHALFILPHLCFFMAQLVFPLLWGMWLSLHKVDLFGPGHFVGLTNDTLPQRDNIAKIAQTGRSLPAEVQRQFAIQSIIGKEVGAAVDSDKPVDDALASAESPIKELLGDL